MPDVFLAGLLDPVSLLTGAGPWVLLALAAIIFVETGLLFPFLPGDSLLFAAGLLSPQLGLPIPLVLVVAAAAAIAGDQIGYLLGRRYGRRLFSPDARILKSSYLEQADAFFLKHGARALVLARFVPIARTFVHRSWECPACRTAPSSSGTCSGRSRGSRSPCSPGGGSAAWRGSRTTSTPSPLRSSRCLSSRW